MPETEMCLKVLEANPITVVKVLRRWYTHIKESEERCKQLLIHHPELWGRNYSMYAFHRRQREETERIIRALYNNMGGREEM